MTRKEFADRWDIIRNWKTEGRMSVQEHADIVRKLHDLHAQAFVDLWSQVDELKKEVAILRELSIPRS